MHNFKPVNNTIKTYRSSHMYNVICIPASTENELKLISSETRWGQETVINI